MRASSILLLFLLVTPFALPAGACPAGLPSPVERHALTWAGEPVAQILELRRLPPLPPPGGTSLAEAQATAAILDGPGACGAVVAATAFALALHRRRPVSKS